MKLGLMVRLPIKLQKKYFAMKRCLNFVFVFCLIFGMANIVYSQTSKCIPKSNASCAKKAATCDTSKNKKPNCVIVACGPEGTKVREAEVIIQLREKMVALKVEMQNHPNLKFKAEMIERPLPVGKNDDESLVILQKELVEIEKEINRQIPQTKFIAEKNKSKFNNKAQWVASLNQRVEQLKNSL